MIITVNGEQKDLAAGSSVQALLAALAIDAKATVVQRNGNILDRDGYAGEILADGDDLEIVRFVGGG